MPETSVLEIHDSSDESEDEDDVIEEEQIEEYQEMIDELGNFPEKVKINSLSMVAEDHAESKKSARALYKCIRDPLMSPKVASDRKLPLVYVIDSILKNVKGKFLPIIEEDAKIWMPKVFDVLSDEQRVKLRKVWNIWKEFGVFKESSWKEMGKPFLNADSVVSTAKKVADSKTKAAGILKAPDGSLKLPAALRKEMQILLDEAHEGMSELDKVSLERLADINPDLLVEIKKAAKDVLSSGQSSSSNTGQTSLPGGGEAALNESSIFVETRPPELLERSKEWGKIKLDHLEVAHELIGKLQHHIMSEATSEQTHSLADVMQMTGHLAAASVTATQITNLTQRLKDISDGKLPDSSGVNGIIPGGQMFPGAVEATPNRHFMSIDKTLFTNDGLKKKNDSVIGLLYNVGLPFTSSSDGRRFATQIELSNHLDQLFKKSQLEKSMERTEERGWYISGLVWTGEETATKASAVGAGEGETEATGTSVAEEESDPTKFTVPADESRDRCVICGINFKMVFDNDDGIYKYNNCREIVVLQDEAAVKESESMLVHVTCWRGLGSPVELTSDQALQDAQY